VGISAANFARQDFGTSHGSSKIQLISISAVCGGHRDFCKLAISRRASGHTDEPW
jgi:hypothetical protein